LYDIAIVGAGPAGATLARLLAPRYTILLVDRRRLDKPPGGRSKCCGGLVAPDAQKVIAELGLGLPRHVLSGPQLFVVRTIDLKRKQERFYQRFYINIHRELFDRWLFSLVPPQVDTLTGASVCRLSASPKCHSLTIRQGNYTYTRACRVLVGADGAGSLVRRLFFPGSRPPTRYIAIQETLQADKVLPYFTALFHSDYTDFYAWTIPKQQHLLFGAALRPGTHASACFAALKGELPAWGINTGKLISRKGGLLLRPGRLNQLCLGSDNVALVGEAAGWISPSSAEGFSYAMRSARALANSLLKGTDGFQKRYRRNTRSLRLNIRFKLAKSLAMYRPPARGIILRSGLGSVRVAPE